MQVLDPSTPPRHNHLPIFPRWKESCRRWHLLALPCSRCFQLYLRLPLCHPLLHRCFHILPLRQLHCHGKPISCRIDGTILISSHISTSTMSSRSITRRSRYQMNFSFICRSRSTMV